MEPSYGMRAEGARRQARVEKGENRDSAWFPLLDHEWPVADEAMRRWLDDDKFDRRGRQKQRLRDIREAIRKMIVVSSRCMLEIKGLLTFLFAKCCANPLPAGRPRKTK